MARVSVPKFGDWGSGGNEDTPYTICFDNARKGRSSSGKIFNPNDPQQNPNLFPTQRDEPRKVNKTQQTRPVPTGGGSTRKVAASATTPPARTPHNGLRPQSYGGPTTTTTPTPFDVRGARGGANGVVLPKFGEWDVKNSASGEGYTQVFNKVREEKKSGGMTPVHVQADTRGQKNSAGGHKESMDSCCFPWSMK